MTKLVAIFLAILALACLAAPASAATPACVCGCTGPACSCDVCPEGVLYAQIPAIQPTRNAPAPKYQAPAKKLPAGPATVQPGVSVQVAPACAGCAQAPQAVNVQVQSGYTRTGLVAGRKHHPLRNLFSRLRSRRSGGCR